MTFPLIFQRRSASGSVSHAELALRRKAVCGGLRFVGRMALAAALLLAALPVVAQDPKPTEYQVKAAYLSDLGEFVEQWGTRPRPGAGESFELCVLGQDPFGSALDIAVKGEKIGGSPLISRRISRAQDALSCRVLFVSASEESQWSAVVAVLGTTPILTVADMPNFIKRGGMIQFVMDGSRVKFEINLAAAHNAGLALSSELLKVARSVKRTL